MKLTETVGPRSWYRSGEPEILLEIGVVTATDLDRIVVAKAREAILGLFDSDDADFSFDEAETAGPKAVQLDFQVQDVLLEGMKRIDDKERIGSIFKDPSMVVAHTGQEPDAEVFTEWPKRETYMAIDGERTIEEITLRVHGTEFRVALILLHLLEDGLIEPRGLRPLSPQDDEAVTPTTRDTETILESETAREELLDKIPVPTKPRHEITAAGISAEEDFLLSLSDGTWDVRALIWVAPMRPADVLSGLERLQERGFVELQVASTVPGR